MESRLISIISFSIIVVLLFCSFYGLYESIINRTKTTVNLKNYKGAILLNRKNDYKHSSADAYIHTFKKNDSIWSESYNYECFAEYQINDTIKL